MKNATNATDSENHIAVFQESSIRLVWHNEEWWFSGTLETALAQSACTGELIVHSDQGWHHKMQPYRAMLVQRRVKQSMSRKGNCFDNAAIAAPNSLDTLEAGVHECVRYYNHERIKLRLNGLNPVGYRLKNTA